VKKLIFIIAVFISGNAVAEQALMRLFYTPAERALIDLKRHAVKKPTQVKSKRQEQTQRIEVKGYLKRKGQPDTVWLNSVNTLKSNKPLSDVKVLRVQSNGKVKLRVSGKGIVKIKPGQIVTRNKKSIREAYEK
jgi:hypothetical protein